MSKDSRIQDELSSSMTGGRLKRLKSYIEDRTFMVTYGDGLSDINIKSLLELHASHGKMVTMTGVRPSARFGEIKAKNNKVTIFKDDGKRKSELIRPLMGC